MQVFALLSIVLNDGRVTKWHPKMNLKAMKHRQDNGNYIILTMLSSRRKEVPLRLKMAPARVKGIDAITRHNVH